MPDMPTAMTSSRPYLIRAMYEWIVDNNLTPYLLVDAEQEGVEVPLGYVEDGKIVLNVGPGASRDLDLGSDIVTFSARFNGNAMWVTAPVPAVLAIYAKENGQGMMFNGEEQEETAPAPSGGTSALSAVPAEGDSGSDDEPPSGGGPSGGKRPTLRVVK